MNVRLWDAAAMLSGAQGHLQRVQPAFHEDLAGYGQRGGTHQPSTQELLRLMQQQSAQQQTQALLNSTAFMNASVCCLKCLFPVPCVFGANLSLVLSSLGGHGTSLPFVSVPLCAPCVITAVGQTYLSMCVGVFRLSLYMHHG
jgi:hypothetical protein